MPGWHPCQSATLATASGICTGVVLLLLQIPAVHFCPLCHAGNCWPIYASPISIPSVLHFVVNIHKHSIKKNFIWNSSFKVSGCSMPTPHFLLIFEVSPGTVVRVLMLIF